MIKGNFKLRISLSSFRLCRRSKKSSSSPSMPMPRSRRAAAETPDKSSGIVPYPNLPPSPPPPPSTPDHSSSKRSYYRVLSFGSSDSGCGSYNLVISSTPDMGSRSKCKMMKDSGKFHEHLCNSPASDDESLIIWPINSRNPNHEISYAVMKKSKNPYEDFKKSMMEMIVEKEIYEQEELEKLLMCFLSLNSQEHQAAILDAFTQVLEELSQL